MRLAGHRHLGACVPQIKNTVMEVVVQLFFYARRFAVGAFQDRREFLRRPEILVVASFQYFPFFAVFLAHNRRNNSARRSLRQA